MANLRWNELFRVLFLAGFLAYLSVWICGIVWVGIPALVGFGWLFYDFRRKVAVFMKILRREFWQEVGKSSMIKLQKSWGDTKEMAKDVKEFVWESNNVKKTTIIGPIMFSGFLLVLMLSVPPYKPISDCIFAGIVWLLLVCIAACIGNFTEGPTDRQIGRFFIWEVPKFLFWTGWKLLFKTIILTIRAVHSRELAAVAMYSLGGMGYIIAFPPFGLGPTTVFLLAIGCGLFTGAFGLAIHKALLTTFAQHTFAKVEAW